jgi:phosphoglycolate phosphatase-like HAD superfamily hydrolase
MKTIICDIDGTLIEYIDSRTSVNGVYNEEHKPLPGVIEKIREWEVRGCRIVLITGRRESERKRTETELNRIGIPFDMLIMGFADTGRVLINDIGKQGQCKAHAVSLPRDQGFNEYDWGEVGL